MILAVDVDYRGDKAYVSGVVFDHWSDEEPGKIVHSVVDDVKAYEPGKFYLREMPCILQLLKEHRLHPELIVIDGYVYLGEPEHAGLGMHLYNALNGKVAIVGVAKKAFKGTQDDTEIVRGKSAKPLYVTAVGMTLENAKAHVRSMHGKYRLPTLLKAVDRECRGNGQ